MGDEKEFDRTVLVAKRLMNDAKNNLSEAIEKEDYGKANELEHYIAGMDQVIITFEMSKKRILNQQ